MGIIRKKNAPALALLLTTTGVSGSPPDMSGEISGQIGVESRIFAHDGTGTGQDRIDLSGFGEVEYYNDWNNGSQRFAVTPFLRLDTNDRERTHFDFRELYYRRSFDDLQLDVYVGARKVFWGVTESLHLVDVINQTDLVENIDGEDKLGQPMVQFAWEQDWGLVELFYLPFFRERTFPGVNGRLRAPLVVDTDNPAFESSAAERHQDFAIRYSHTLGDFDFGIAHFSGTSRDPRLIPTVRNGETVLTPYYDQLEQSSVDLQYTGDAWLWKLEALTRHSFDGRSNAAVGGFEYTFYGLNESALDLGVIAEYLYDDRDGDAQSGVIQPIGDNDFAFGGRLTFNDTNDTDLLALVTVDPDTGSQLYTIEADRRIGNDWEIEVQARIFADANDIDEPLNIFNNEDYIQVTLRRFF